MSSISNLSDISSLTNGTTTLTLNAAGGLSLNKTAYMSYLTVNQTDANGEGGEIRLLGANGYPEVRLDNYQGNARILSTSGDYTFQVITSDGVTQIRGTGIDNENWKMPTFVNSWTNYGDGTIFNTAGYFKDKLGNVHLRGMVASGTVSVTMFTLPAGYRPMHRVLYGTVSNTGTGRIDVDTAGNVIHVAGGNGWITLDSLVFRAV